MSYTGDTCTVRKESLNQREREEIKKKTLHINVPLHHLCVYEYDKFRNKRNEYKTRDHFKSKNAIAFICDNQFHLERLQRAQLL